MRHERLLSVGDWHAAPPTIFPVYHKSKMRRKVPIGQNGMLVSRAELADRIGACFALSLGFVLWFSHSCSLCEHRWDWRLLRL